MHILAQASNYAYESGWTNVTIKHLGDEEVQVGLYG
jgi:hypothetical protein